MHSKADVVNRLFDTMGIGAHVTAVSDGLRTRRYKVKLDIGERVSKIRAIREELSLATQSISPPLIELDSSSGHVVIEVTTTNKPIIVSLDQLINQVDLSEYELPLLLGSSMQGGPFVIDLMTGPHLLIGGATGSGKSVLSKTIIHSLIHKLSPKDLQFGLIDPKGTELSSFKKGEYCGSYASDYESTCSVLDRAINIMERRYELLSSLELVNIQELRKRGNYSNLFYIVIIIDELADLILQDRRDRLFSKLVKLLQKSRAAGIHIIANTQRPSRDVIKGLIHANMPIQIALRTTSNHDSRVIIGTDGAEDLVGRGDMLVRHNGTITRVQGAIV